MEINLEPGMYVVAVSGGIDSVSLLHALTTHSQKLKIQLVVAHYDHGIRPDSAADQEFVEKLANDYGLQYRSEAGHLGVSASEAKARTARYNFLRRVQAETGAQALITAHHQDDVLETALLNLSRGTGRKGLTSLAETTDLKRPLLSFPKSQLIAYATDNHLIWHEDSTNTDNRYRRNYVRHQIVATMSPAVRKKFLAIIAGMTSRNLMIDGDLNALLRDQLVNGQLDRRWFSSLPHALSKEVLASWLRQNQLAQFDSPGLDRLVIGAKVAANGKRLDIADGCSLVVGRHHLALARLER